MSNMKGYLAILTTIGFLGILTGLALGTLKASENPAILILFGSLASGWGAVISYYFGSADTQRVQRKSDEEPKKEAV